MPNYLSTRVGFELHFTSRIPSRVAEALKNQNGAETSFDLTPNWGVVPTLSVLELRMRGIEVPSHWSDNDVVAPIVHGQAFYIGDIELGQGAVSFSMKGVNLRTGRKEIGHLTDDPTQSYWAPKVDLPWIDGFVPSDGLAVRQFVPLRGETEMGFDVARHVGISDDDPYIDALTGRFYLPKKRVARTSIDHGFGDSPVFRGGGLLGGTRGGRSLDIDMTLGANAPVGIGAGARMRQRHQENPHFKCTDFDHSPWIEMTVRLMWVEAWNMIAGQRGITSTLLSELEQRQALYESRLMERYGISQPVVTDVDSLPVVS